MSKSLLQCILDAVRNIRTYSVTVPAEDIANAIVAKQRDVTPRLFSFENTNSVEDLGLPVGTFGRIASIEDVGGGLVRWTIDGSNPTSTNGFTTNGPYHSGYDLNNVDLGLVRLDGSAATSDYYVAVEIYN